MIDPAQLLAELDTRVRGLGAAGTSALRAVRRAISRQLRDADPAVVLALANRLVERDGGSDRFFAYEIITSHRRALASVQTPQARRLGRGMDSWGDVDTFACYIAGPAWREGQIPDGEIARWAASPDRLWRRAAVVSTVPLNSRALGVSGVAKRTLAVF